MTDTGNDAETVAEIVSDLRQDPILVQQLLGNGHTREVTAGLRALADDVGQPVFVALVQRPAGLANERPNDDLLRLIHQGLGKPGIYLVQTQDSILAVNAYDVPIDPTDLHLASYDALATADADLGQDTPLSDAGAVALTLRAAAEPGFELSAPQVREVVGDPQWVTSGVDEPSPYDHVGETLTPVVVAVAVGVTAAVLAWRLLRARAARADTPVPLNKSGRVPAAKQPAVPDVASLQRRLDTRLTKLERALARSKAGLSALDTAQGCRDVAGELAGSDDLLEIVGALVIVANGQAALAARSDEPAPYHPCFFNPLHGEARSTVRAEEAGASVPVCASCSAVITKGEQPDALLVGTGRRRAPYYEGSSVWAQTGCGSLVDDLWRRVDARDER